MSLMRLNFLTTYLRNLFLRDATQVVVGTIFVQVLNFRHPFIPSGFLTLSALQTNRIYDQKGNDRQHTRRVVTFVKCGILSTTPLLKQCFSYHDYPNKLIVLEYSMTSI